MSEKTNKIKSEQLGMSFSTASNQLRKALMFQLVQQAGRDNCHRCGEKIDDADNLSIEHVEAWMYSENPKELFFDLNNISFSHRKCNYSESRKKLQIGESGFKGVSLRPDECKDKPYRASISITKGDSRKGMKFIGYFSTAKEAGEAYDKVAKELYGESAITNESLGLL